jgi:magnesium transporter
MLSVRTFRPGLAEVVEDPDQISALAADLDRLLWLDLVDATDEDLERVQREFDLHPLALDDTRRKGQRPKLEVYPTHAFIVVYVGCTDPTDLPELNVFVGPNWVVTVRKRNGVGEVLDIDPIRAHFERTCGEDEATSSFLLYTILDDVVEGYFDLVERMEDDVQSLEDAIFEELDPDTKDDGDQDQPLQRRLLVLRKELLNVRRRVVPMREVLMALLRREVPWIEEAVLLYLQNVLDHVLRVSDEIDAQRELMGNAVDAHLATMSNRVNEIMKRMTSWGAILLGATLIAGIYGMNFKHMPELDSKWGYPLALLTMLVMTIALVIYFRRKRWL